ncbi:hypothetical protein GCM10027052_03090 [Parafrigoribacterium mesophilum]|uniref:Ig-like domain-containing protein n=1 Tax=Parafrigoribacterium mesophilum TaxID=433646 RepID=UPI0031FDEC2D
MFTSLVPRIAGDDEPPDASRHRRDRKRLGAVLAMASALAMGIAMMAAPQPAEAVTSIDGQWTVSHGGTGLITLDIDGTYTSTCQVYPDYEDAWCPAASGTFLYGSGWVDFNGADGSTHSYRVSGLVSSPDTISSVFGSATYSALVMKKGSQFVCTDWSVDRLTSDSQIVDYDAASNLYYAHGSHELISSGSLNLAETAPDYFQIGYCADFPAPPALPTIIIDSATDASIPAAESGYWLPQATVTIKDQAGAPVAGATVNGTFTDSYGQSCVTAADGTCTVSARSTISHIDDTFHAIWLIKDGMEWDGNAVYVTLNKPEGTGTLPEPTPTPTPAPVTHHVVDLDNVSAASSPYWQPQVTITVLDSNGAHVAGASVSGTFSGRTGTETCITAADGSCTVSDFFVKKTTKSTMFTVTDVTAASSIYQPTENSDSEGDSDGTVITVKRP